MSCDTITVMSVKAGLSGQPFNPNALLKVSEIKKAKPNVRVIMDGGINDGNVVLVRLAGVDTAVVGNAIYTAGERAEYLNRIRN